MDRGFSIGDTVLCTESGVVGTVLSFYTPTSCEEQTKVLTNDGRMYHAPTSYWVKYGDRKNLHSPSKMMMDVATNETRDKIVINITNGGNMINAIDVSEIISKINRSYIEKLFMEASVNE